MKKFIALALVCLMACAMIPMMASADETWSYTLVDGVLTVTGTGDVGASTSTKESYPWNAQRAEITSVVIEDGITSLGKNAFDSCTNLTSITVGKDCTVFWNDAFAHNKKITSITFNAPVATLKQGVFYNTALSEGETCAVTLTNQTEEQFWVVAMEAAYNTSKKNAGFVTCLDSATFTTVTADDLPVVPVNPAVTVAPSPFGAIETWSGATRVLVDIDHETKTADIFAGLKDLSLSLKIVMKNETTGKTYTVSKYDLDVATSSKVYDDGSNRFVRFNPCEWGIPMVKDEAWTVSVEITNAEGAVVYAGTSETGAFSKYSASFDATVVPEEVTHYYDEHPSNDQSGDGDVETGDATIIIAALAVVALFGTAVIVKKVHD